MSKCSNQHANINDAGYFFYYFSSVSVLTVLVVEGALVDNA
jgi:hypothetical protein